ncbi:MAG: hypothetical protein U7123_08490 [Potamolinea sp.]
MAITDNDLLIAHIHKINAEIAGQVLGRLETWLKFAADKPTNLPEGLDLDTARENWEQVLLWFEDALLVALFKNDWGEVYDMIRQLKDCKDSKQEEDGTKHREAMENLNAVFDLAFNKQS